MSKIVLNDVTSGYNLSTINSNFQKIEDEINNKMLSRDPQGEPNSMDDILDMNSNRIINLAPGVNAADAMTVGQSLSIVGEAEAARDAAAASAIKAEEEADRAEAIATQSEIDTAEAIAELEADYNLFKIEQQANYDAFVLSQGWEQVGTFAVGFTFTSPNQVGQDVDGNWWRWNGSFPKVVIAGTLPASDSNYKLVGDGVLRGDLASGTADIDGQPASTVSHDVLKYGAIKDLMTAGSANMLAFLDAITSSRHVTAKDGVYYVSDTIEVNSYHNLSLPACTFVTQGMSGKALFKFKLENPTTASEQISVDMGGGSIAGDAAYAFEFVGVDTSPSTQESCRILKITGVTVSSTAMRFAKVTNAAKSLFFTQIWHFGGMFLDTNGKVVETHISNSLIFGSGSDTNGFLMESNGGSNQYSEGLHLANVTIDGYENCFNIRDMFVTTLVSAYVGGSKAFLFRPPTTTHNREFNIGAGCVFAGRIVFQDAVGGVSGNGKIAGAVFAGAVAPVIEVGTGWSAIDIQNIKAESNGGVPGVAVWVKNGCNDININDVNTDVTFSGGVEFTGANGANCRALNVNATVGRAVTSARPIITKNPSLDGVNDIDLHRYSAQLPLNGSVAVGSTFGTLGISLAKGQTGSITVAGRIGGCAAGQTLLIDGISSLSIPDGAGWSSAFIELPAGEHSFCHTIPFIAKSDIPFLLVGLTNSVGNTVAQNSAQAFITVVKDL